MKISIVNLLVFFSLLFFKTSFGQSQIAPIEKGKIDRERLKLKNYAFCTCLINNYPKDSVLAKDGTATGYFELSAYNIEVFDSVNNYSKTFTKQNYRSKYNRPLVMMKCIDFYNSKELNDYISKFDGAIDLLKLNN
jgi:hypothetical protein